MKKYKKDEIIECSVTGFENYGIFVGVDNDFSGLIHISEISDDFVRNINDYITVGEKILAKVIDVDENNLKIKLSIKNVNYKINRDDNKIIESPKGFEPLEKNLKTWTEEKLKEINKS